MIGPSPKRERPADRVNRWVERQAARVSRALPPPPFLASLSKVEASIADELLHQHRARIARAGRQFLVSLAPRGSGRAPRTSGPVNGDEADTSALEAVAEGLVGELRARMECLPMDRPLLGLVARIDQLLPTAAAEHMDDPHLPPPVRQRIADALDKQTRRAGDYLILADLLSPLLPELGKAPGKERFTILDLGSGPGGFPIAVARSAGERNLRIVASDVNTESLALGAKQAALAGVSRTVEFRALDAFRLIGELGDWRPDVITCTRTLHHFGVRGTTRLLALALRSAGRGVLFVDIARSISRMLMAAGAGIGSGDSRFAHDAVVSVRKSFSPAELRLIAACVPGGKRLDVFYTAPAYVVARGVTRGTTVR